MTPPNQGERNGNRKIDEATVLAIFHLRKLGLTSARIARHARIGSSNVCYILRRKTWGHVPLPPDLAALAGGKVKGGGA